MTRTPFQSSPCSALPAPASSSRPVLGRRVRPGEVFAGDLGSEKASKPHASIPGLLRAEEAAARYLLSLTAALQEIWGMKCSKAPHPPTVAW